MLTRSFDDIYNHVLQILKTEWVSGYTAVMKPPAALSEYTTFWGRVPDLPPGTKNHASALAHERSFLHTRIPRKPGTVSLRNNRNGARLRGRFNQLVLTRVRGRLSPSDTVFGWRPQVLTFSSKRQVSNLLIRTCNWLFSCADPRSVYTMARLGNPPASTVRRCGPRGRCFQDIRLSGLTGFQLEGGCGHTEVHSMLVQCVLNLEKGFDGSRETQRE